MAGSSVASYQGNNPLNVITGGISMPSVSNRHSLTHRLFMLKIEAFLQYSFSVFGMAYTGTLMATLKVSLEYFFYLSVASIAIAVISQNAFSRQSDTLKRRLPFAIIANVLYSISMIVLALFPTFPAIVLYTVLNSLLSGEMLSVAIVYELIEDIHTKSMDNSGVKSKSVNKSREFSKYRIMGSLGWSFSAPLAGMLISRLNNLLWSPTAGYSIGFLISGAGVAACTVFMFSILGGYEFSRNASEDGDNGKSEEVFSHVQSHGMEKDEKGHGFYFSLPYLMIVISTCILSIGNAFVENVKYTFIIEGLTRDETFYGILAFTWALSEVPLMFLSSALVKKFSWRMVMVMGFTFNIIKIGSYLFIQPLNSWLMIPMQFFNSFALFYPAYSFAITNEIAPRRKALALSLRQTLIQLGGFTGGVLGAWLSSNVSTQLGVVEPFHLFFKLSITFSILGLISFGTIHLINRWLEKVNEKGN